MQWNRQFNIRLEARRISASIIKLVTTDLQPLTLVEKLKLKDKTPCREIRAKTNIKDVVKFAAKQKWKWAGHVARLNDNRWTKRITDWQPRYGKRSRGRQVKRWRDDIVQMKGITWGRDAGQRDDWRRDAEGYTLQWMDGASV